MTAGPKKPEYEPKTDRQLLAYLIEECGEVLAAAGKSLRWGYASANPELPEEQQETNAAWLRRELDDLSAAVERVCKAQRLELLPEERLHHLRYVEHSNGTQISRLTYLSAACGAIAVAASPIVHRKHENCVVLALRRSLLLDLDAGIIVVRRDLEGHPPDPREARETLLEGAYAL